MKKNVKELYQDRKNQYRYVRWLLHYTKPYMPSLSLLLLIQVLTSLVSIGSALVSKAIIDKATNGHSFGSSVALYGLIVIIAIGLSTFSNYFSVIVTERFAFGIRKQIFDKILHSCWQEIQSYHSGDLVTRLTSDCETIAAGISTNLPSVISLIFELFATFFTLLYFDKTLACFGIIIAPFTALASIWLGRKLKKLQVKVQESEANYRSFLQENISNMLIVKTFNQEDYAVKRFSDLRDERLYWIMKKTRLSIISSTALGFSFQAGYIVAYAWGAIRLSSSEITYGTMSVFLTLVNKIQAPIVGLANMIPKIVSILASAGRIIELEQLSKEDSKEDHIAPEQIGIQINDLSFGYCNDLLFQHSSATIHSGEFIAIVGESGIGKTTLVRLIMSFMSSPEGFIAFTNKYGEQETANSGCRQFLSYVPQGNTLFSGTILYNIQMANHNASEEEIIEVLKASSAYEFVKELPNGIDTVIGERGYGLSEGQAQRIAIARALIRKAPFLILDEATSSLDEKTELEVLKNIRAFHPAPTCLLITHRRSVLDYCDREFKIENKQICEVSLHN